jgi:hypothetical protein
MSVMGAGGALGALEDSAASASSAAVPAAPCAKSRPRCCPDEPRGRRAGGLVWKISSSMASVSREFESRCVRRSRISALTAWKSVVSLQQHGAAARQLHARAEAEAAQYR